ncbi:MAG: hypothetical protein LBE91_07615 [Tannerella sp.]|jgi:hypothetical protein|nr:hypothetical protein [Tannerella sp.]
MNKKTKIIFLMALLAVTVFGQQDKPLKWGIELDGRLRWADDFRPYAFAYGSGVSSTGLGYVGAFAEYRLSGHFSGKLRAGLNNTYMHQPATSGDGYNVTTGETEFISLPEYTKIPQTLEFGFEPRYYLFSTKQPRKINVFFAVPVMFETKSFEKAKYIFQTKLMIIPSLGLRYDFNEHWGMEAGGGWGWRKYGKSKNHFGITSYEEYSLSAGIRYTF